MSRLLDDDQDLERDRELTLSTGAILAIFLGLVLLCALFFGFGYNLGRKSTVSIPGASVAAPATEPAQPSDSSTFNSFKPSPSSPAASHTTTSLPTVTLPESTTAAPPRSSTPEPAPAPTLTTKPRETPIVPRLTPPAPGPVHTTPPAAAPATTPTSVPTAPTTVPTGAFVVQVAAVSRKDDADLLVNALHAKGYQVAARSSTQDKLLHIQVGPFATRKDAEAMREKLIIDGYNAIVK